MRADTKKKHNMGKRFTIVIGVAAVGVMALGAQTGAAATDVVSYGTRLTIFNRASAHHLHGEVNSKVRPCWEGREVIVFRKRPGPDRKLGATTSGPQASSHNWWVTDKKLGISSPGGTYGKVWRRVYAKVTREVGDGFVCRADKSRVLPKKTWRTLD